MCVIPFCRCGYWKPSATQIFGRGYFYAFKLKLLLGLQLQSNKNRKIQLYLLCLGKKEKMKIRDLWDNAPCSLVVDRRFRGAYWLHHQGGIPERSDIQSSRREKLENSQRKKMVLKLTSMYLLSV
jgi:hypothetical protein